MNVHIVANQSIKSTSIMGESEINYALFEHAVGYALFKVKAWEEIGMGVQSVSDAMASADVFCRAVTLEAFQPFADAESALANANAISEGLCSDELHAFLSTHVPSSKKAKRMVAVQDSKLAASIGERVTFIGGVYSATAQQWLRGIRVHFEKLAGKLTHHAISKSQLSVGHSYSRSKVKFNVHRVDNMIIQSIALLDQLDKDINTFSMRLREWYSYHYPELYKLVPDQIKYCKSVLAVKDRKAMPEDIQEKLMEIILDEALVAEVLESARTSMGMDISPIDLINVQSFAARVTSLVTFRAELQDYLKERMHDCAPNLAALIGEQVGARLISHAGSLMNLAKYPASTVQILGAEKALFRALKTKGNTPKYGLLFHSTHIGRASTKNKGRISRYLANKCSIASRIDAFSETPVSTYGEFLRGQVDDRLAYFETGKKPKKNIDVMLEAKDDAVVATKSAKKRARKRAKKEGKTGEEGADTTMDTTAPLETPKKRKRTASTAATEDEGKEEEKTEVKVESKSAKKNKKKKSKA
jgi:nucleolar protein 56